MNAKLSIITVCFNDKAGLEKTIQSVLQQTAADFEFVVIDGGSTDGSVSVLEKYVGRIHYWVSEPDKGIYNAMNKAVGVARGEYCLFLNAGDVFFDSSAVQKFIDANPAEDILSGKEVCTKDGKTFIAYRNPPQKATLLYFMRQTLAHQSTFIKTELLKALPYDETYKIASDYIFFFEAFFKKGATYRRLDFFVSIFEMSGISSTDVNLSAAERERFFASMFPVPVAQQLKGYALSNDFFTQMEGKTFLSRLFGLLLRIVRTLNILSDKAEIRKANKTHLK